MPRRLIMVATDLGRDLLLAWVPLAAYMGVLTIEQLYLVAFGIGLLAVCAELAGTSIVPSLVAREQIFDANSHVQITSGVANIGEPSLAVALVQAIGAPFAIAFDALSLFLSGLLVGTIRVDEAARAARRAPAGYWREIREGLVGLLGTRVIRDMTISSALGNLGGQVMGAVFFLYMVEELAFAATTIGIVLAMSAVGSVMGAAVSSRVGRRIGSGPAVVYGTLLYDAAQLARAFAAGPWALPLLLVLQPVQGFGGQVYSVNQIGIRQQMTPDHLLGRVNASRRFIVFGIGPIGALVGGYLGEAIGLGAILFVGGAIGMVAFLWVYLSLLRRMREVPP